MARLLFSLVLSLAISGCGDLREMALSPSEKLNDAYLPDAAIRVAETRLRALLSDNPEALEHFESQYASRLEVRGVTCAQDLKIGRFDTLSAVRKLPVSQECLSLQDEQLKQFVGIRLIGLHLAQGPLRPPVSLGSVLPFSDSDLGTYDANAASAAGVAVVMGTRQEYASVDLTSGRKLADLGAHPGAGHRITISPNGRVVALSSRSGGAVFLDAETGESLWNTKDVYEVLGWLPELAGALVTIPKSQTLAVLDFQTGKLTPHNLALTQLTWAIPLDAANKRIALGNHYEYSVIDHVRDASGIVGSIERTQRFSPGRGVTSTWPTSVFSGKAMVFASRQDLMMVDIESGNETFWKTGEFLQNRFAKVDETTLLIDSVAPKGIGTTPRLFNLEAETLATVEGQHPDGLLIGFTNRTGFARRGHSKIWFGDTVTGSEPQPLAQLIDAFHLERQLARLEAASRVETTADNIARHFPERIQSAAPPPPRESAPDPFLFALARNARIEAVGVYQGKGASRRNTVDSGKREAGEVVVRIRPSSKPLMLVLTSYEPVKWKLIREPGAPLLAVLVSGYHKSDVSGAGAARVLDLGRSYAYARESREYSDLNRGVLGRTGKSIDLFQGRYEGSSFEVGP